jgi:hypothetical protein
MELCDSGESDMVFTFYDGSDISLGLVGVWPAICFGSVHHAQDYNGRTTVR